MRLQNYLTEKYRLTRELNWTNWAPKSWTFYSDAQFWDKQAGAQMAKKFADQITPLLKKSFDTVNVSKIHNIMPSTNQTVDWKQFIGIDFRNKSMKQSKLDMFGVSKQKRTGKGLKKYLPGSPKKTITEPGWVTLRLYILKNDSSNYFLQPQIFNDRGDDAVFPNWKNAKDIHKSILEYIEKELL